MTAVDAAGLVAGLGSAPSAAAGQNTEGSPSTDSVVVWTQFVDLDFSAARIAIAGPHGENTGR